MPTKKKIKTLYYFLACPRPSFNVVLVSFEFIYKTNTTNILAIQRKVLSPIIKLLLEQKGSQNLCVTEFGCGETPILPALQGMKKGVSLSYTGIDINEKYIEKNNKAYIDVNANYVNKTIENNRVIFWSGDAKDYSTKNPVDCVAIIHPYTKNHDYNGKEVFNSFMNTCHRILRKNGIVIIATYIKRERDTILNWIANHSDFKILSVYKRKNFKEDHVAPSIISLFKNALAQNMDFQKIQFPKDMLQNKPIYEKIYKSIRSGDLNYVKNFEEWKESKPLGQVLVLMKC